MNPTLSSLVKTIFDRTTATRRVSALTGGLSNIDSVIITSPGGGYTTAPTVSFIGGGGSGATAVATIANGVIVAITITNPGTGYTSTPAVAFSGGSGSGAVATAITAPTTLDAMATASISAGEMIATIVIAQLAHTYQLVEGTDAEAAPAVIRPDDYDTGTNAKVWKLQGVFLNALTLLDGSDVQLGTEVGTRLATAASQKLGFFGVPPVVQPSGADQAAVVTANTENAIGSLPFSDPPSQAECLALRDKCEELAGDVRALSNLIHAIRTAGAETGIWKGSI